MQQFISCGLQTFLNKHDTANTSILLSENAHIEIFAISSKAYLSIRIVFINFAEIVGKCISTFILVVNRALYVLQPTAKYDII